MNKFYMCHGSKLWFVKCKRTLTKYTQMCFFCRWMPLSGDGANYNIY